MVIQYKLIDYNSRDQSSLVGPPGPESWCLQACPCVEALRENMLPHLGPEVLRVFHLLTQDFFMSKVSND